MVDFGFPFQPRVSRGSSIFALECLGPVKNYLSCQNYFLKSFLKGKFCGLESERGVNSILITPLCVFDQLPEKIELFT